MGSLLTVFGIDWKMLIIESINFLVLLGGLSYFLYRPTMKLLADRQEKIAEGIKDAEKAKIAAQEIEQSRTGILSAAEREAEGVVDRALEEGKKERAELVKSAQKQSDSIISDARAQAEELQRQALSQSQKEIARLAVLAAEKILKES